MIVNVVIVSPLLDSAPSLVGGAKIQRLVFSRHFDVAFEMMMETTISFDVEESTSNDEAIARAIAESDERERSLAQRNNNNNNNSYVLLSCPGKHGLQRYIASNSQRVSCNGCHKKIRPGGGVWSCVECNYDSCESCFANATFPSSPITTTIILFASSYHVGSTTILQHSPLVTYVSNILYHW